MCSKTINLFPNSCRTNLGSLQGDINAINIKLIYDDVISCIYHAITITQLLFQHLIQKDIKKLSNRKGDEKHLQKSQQTYQSSVLIFF